jgi:hypothetical protein
MGLGLEMLELHVCTLPCWWHTCFVLEWSLSHEGCSQSTYMYIRKQNPWVRESSQLCTFMCPLFHNHFLHPCFSDATINYLLGLDISELCCCIGSDTLALCLSDLTWRLYSQATYLHIRKQNAVKLVHWENFHNEKQEVVQLRTRNCNGEKCPRSPRAAIKAIRNVRGGRAWQTHRRRRRAWKHYLLRMGFTQKTRVC